MKRGLNQLNNPDWFEKGHWMGEVVCQDEPYVEGELTLHATGDAKIGTRMFGPGIPIDEWPFAGGYVAKRRIDRPEWLVIRTPGGNHHYYRYRKLLGCWQRYTPLVDPTLDRCVGTFGPRLGSLLCAAGRTATGICQGIVQLVLGALLVGATIGCWWLVAVVITLLAKAIAPDVNSP